MGVFKRTCNVIGSVQKLVQILITDKQIKLIVHDQQSDTKCCKWCLLFFKLHPALQNEIHATSKEG